MICELCKVNEASIKLIEIINGEKFETYICKECAKKKGLTNPESYISMAIDDAISKLAERKRKKVQQSEKKRLTCPFCRTTLSEFKATGKLGCKHCYSVFWFEISSIFNKYQGLKDSEIPDMMIESTEEKISKLKRELKKVIKREDYEKAAVIRDKINHLTNNN